MARRVNLDLGLAPHDPWVIKKSLSESDIRSQLKLPRREFEASILPEMHGQVSVADMVNGVEVKVHIVEEGHEAPDHILKLFLYQESYMLKIGWSTLARAKGYKTNDVLGIMWDKWSARFFLHRVN